MEKKLLRPVPAVAAVHDISGVGRCALTVAIPVISAMGVQVCPVPTACLSAHTAFKDIETVDLTGFLGRMLDAWKRTGEKFDGIYTGYLGSPAQAELIADFMDSQDSAVKLVDPVMGDDGALYSGITDEMARAMHALCRRATLITPNMTEYAALTGEKYSLADRSAAEVEKMLNRLDARSVIITSVPCEGALVNACRDEKGRVSLMPIRRMERHYPGTGDLFASVVCGALVQGEGLDAAVSLASEYVSHTIEVSMGIDIPSEYGVQLEATLPMLMARREEV